MFKACFSRLSSKSYNRSVINSIRSNTTSLTDSTIQLEIPRPERKNESFTQRKARLLYQSRKRGMLENDLLLSTFADKHLHLFTPELLDQYDKLINEPSNDWDLYYWLTGKEEPPVEFKTQVFDMLKDHTQNKQREVRCRQPSLRIL